MGQILTRYLRDYWKSEGESTVSNFRTEAFQEETANEGQGFAEAATNIAWVKVARGAREAQWEHERARKTLEDVERAQKAADEQRREAENATEANEEAERRLKEVIQPVVTPSSEELAAAKRRIQYNEDCVHFAVAGMSGSGKSSLINAFRGLRNRDAGAAVVGGIERTLQVTRYPDANPGNPFVWYEIPGAGAVKRHDWQYFNDQGLYVFDSIVVLFDNRFTVTDIAILDNAKRFNIPTYIVRSKADQCIRNIMMDSGYDSDDDNEDIERRNKRYDAARKQFIEQTRKSVQIYLENANLPDQRVYIISSTTLLSIMRNMKSKRTIDEAELLHDLFNQTYTRRAMLSDEMASTRIGSWLGE